MGARVKPLAFLEFMGGAAVAVPGSASAFGFSFGVPYYGYYKLSCLSGHMRLLWPASIMAVVSTIGGPTVMASTAIRG